MKSDLNENENNFPNYKTSFPLEKYPEFGTTFHDYFINFATYVQRLDQCCTNKAFIQVYPNNKSQKIKYIYLFITPVENDINAEGTLKFQMKVDSIESILIRYSEDNNSIISSFFIKLDYVPKVFLKVKNSVNQENINLNGNKFKKEFFFNSFKKIYNYYDYNNHYHITTESKNGTSGKIITVKEFIQKQHKKFEKNFDENKKNSIFYENFEKKINESQKNENTNDEFNNNNNKDFLRIDSFLSKDNEFLNFYLLNLILKIKIRFPSKKELIKFIFSLGISDLIKNEDINQYKRLSDEKFLRNKETLFYKYFVRLHFNVQYSILSLITQKRLNFADFDIDFMKYLSSLSCDDQEKAWGIIDEINRNSSYTKEKLNYHQQLSKIFKELFNISVNQSQIEERTYLTITRTIEITPSIIYYSIPKYEKTNHLIRKYSEYNDHFLKINIVDEDKNKMYFNSFTAQKLSCFISSLMHEGIYIGSRFFQFISSSNSQMKNCSFWLINIEGTRFVKRENIIQELGDFTMETNIYKNASRRGQCLSSTIYITTLQKENIIEIPDIRKNRYVFTDGIGQISTDLAFKCAKILKCPKNFASAFQIRFGGVKGVVAINPALEGDIICIRPSMIKFKSEDLELGVVRAALHSLGYLNRQIIILLYSLGVSENIFINMVKDIVDNYTNVVRDPYSSFRKNKTLLDEILMKCYFFSPLIKYYSYNKTYGIKEDPFANALLLNIVASLLRELKNKGKIVDNKSASLIGVFDETNSLEENEVYVRIMLPNNDEITLSDEVFITKNPCLHPGDIRILKANPNCPLLSHLVNVVVFSSKGERPVPNMIGGGDLDGDTYYVSWNEKIINSIKLRNVQPLEDPNYTEGVINSKDAPNKSVITMEDITNTYIDATKHSHVPLISNLHSAFADADLERGAFNEKCIELSKMFSVEIDSAKHGRFIDPTIFEKKDLNLKAYPDFLNIEGYPSYESKGILGKLYRLVDKDNIVNEYDINDNITAICQEYDINIDIVTYESIKYSLQALDIYSKYQNDILNLMAMFNCSCESELFICENIHNYKIGKQNKQNDTFSELNLIKEKYSKMVLDVFDGNITQDVASACYLVTYVNQRALIQYKTFFDDNKYGTQLTNKLRQLGIIPTRKDVKSCIRRKRIFSFPWFIKEIREVLLFKKK